MHAAAWLTFALLALLHSAGADVYSCLDLCPLLVDRRPQAAKSASSNGCFLTPEQFGTLERFYFATGGPRWLNNTGWLNASRPVQEWFGLSCDSFALDSMALSGNNLVGAVPSLAGLSMLSSVDLSNNELTAMNWTGFPALIVSLAGNPQLVVSDMPRLLYLEELYLAGIRSAELPANGTGLPCLQLIDVSRAALSEHSSFASYPCLEGLKMQQCGLKTLPSLPSALNQLDCSNNELASLPLRNMSQLTTLIANNNRLTEFPQLRDCARLLVVDVSRNRMGGLLPTFEHNPLLYSVVASHNRLRGASPDWSLVSSRSALLFLNLASNRMQADPSERWPISLLNIDLSNNPTLTALPNSAGAGGGVGALQFMQLQLLRLENTSVSLIPMLRAGTLRSDDSVLRSTDSTTEAYSCLGLAGGNAMSPFTVTASPSATNTLFCTCNLGFFRASTNESCLECDPSCQCSGSYIANCFPSRDRKVLRCPLLPSGANPCQGNTPFPANRTDAGIAAWCMKGHTGRMCAGCVDGYYADGRRCLECPSSAVPGTMVGVYTALFLALVALLYADSGSDEAIADAATDASPLLLHKFAAAGSGEAGGAGAGGEAQHVHGKSRALNILVFHSQQLGVLMSAGTVFPQSVLSVLSPLTASTSFSLSSSYLALECAPLSVSRSALLWLCSGLLALLLVLGVLLLLRVQCCPPASDASARRARRWLSVCLALLTLLFLPSAQLGFSALACTDLREEHAHLNQLSSQTCNAQWRETIFPPALLLSALSLLPLLLLIVFAAVRCCAVAHVLSQSRSPSLQQLLLSWRLYNALAAVLSPVTRGYRATHAAWEAVQYTRRLFLAALIAFVPYWSPYLPLALLLVMQLATLAQYSAQPYLLPDDNNAEIVSLALLSANYLTGLVMAFNGDVVEVWLVAILIANGVFLLALAALALHSHSGRFRALFERWCGCCRCCCRGGSAGDDEALAASASASGRVGSVHGLRRGGSALNEGDGGSMGGGCRRRCVRWCTACGCACCADDAARRALYDDGHSRYGSGLHAAEDD